MAKKKSLGRGLSAILGEVEQSYQNNMSDNSELVIEIDIDIIKPNPYQPRKIFKQDSINELSKSIKEYGLLQPVLVYEDKDGGYVLIAGERRLRASKMAGLSSIKAIIADIDLTKLREVALIENIQREDLNPIELANSYKELIEVHELTHEQLADRLQKSRAQITNTLRLLGLDDSVKKMVEEEKIAQGHAKIIASLDRKDQIMVADSVVGQRLSVRDTENLVKDLRKKDNIEPTLDATKMNKIRQRLSSLGIKSGYNQGVFAIRLKSNKDLDSFMSIL